MPGPDNAAFRKLFAAFPGLRGTRDAALRELVGRGDEIRRTLAIEHARLAHFYPDDERSAYTAAAVILLADALHGRNPTATLFTAH